MPRTRFRSKEIKLELRDLRSGDSEGLCRLRRGDLDLLLCLVHKVHLVSKNTTTDMQFSNEQEAECQLHVRVLRPISVQTSLTRQVIGYDPKPSAPKTCKMWRLSIRHLPLSSPQPVFFSQES